MEVTPEQVYKMIEKVRCETHLSHKLASHAVYVVFKNLSSLTPECVVTINPINEILKKLEMPLEAPDSLIDNTQDMARLFIISEGLDAIKNDAQQRSWELFDDQGPIMEYLNELNCILSDADTVISRRFLHVTDYYIVNCLAEYYQMESRWSIKCILLKTFDLLCNLSRTVIVILLQTVLPLELVRDVQNDYKDSTRLIPILNVLVKMFSIGEPLPVIYFDTIGKEFILFLLHLIETPCSDPEYEDIILHSINYILVYNLQFDSNKPISDNITIQAFAESNNPKVFSETLLLLFNRGKDPVKFLDHQPYPQSSLLKIITDIFSSEATSNLFYKNDVKVLIEIVLRQLNDISPNNVERTQWLMLIKKILLKTDSSIWIDRVSDIQSCVLHILAEEEIQKLIDQKLIDEITKCLSRISN